MDRRSFRPEAAWLRKPPPVRTNKRPATSDRRHEYFAAIYSSAHRYLTVDDRTVAGGYRGLQATADFRPAAGGLSHDPDRDVLSRRQPRRDGVFDHGAAGAPVRRTSRSQPN